MPTINETLALAVKHHQAGQLQAAEQTYHQVLRAKPSHADALHLLGVIAQQEGRYEVAVDYIRRAIASNARAVAFHVNLGSAYQGLGRLAEAVGSYDRALKINPNLAEAHYNRGNVLRDQGKPAEAAASYHRALQVAPDYAEAHNNLSAVLAQQGKHAEAVASCERAVQINPDLAEAHYNLGRSLEQQGKLEEAANRYRLAVGAQPDYVQAHFHLANVLKEQGELDEAAAGYRRALQVRTDFAEAYNNLGNVLRDQGNLDDALESYRQALQVNPDYSDAHNNLGNALRDQDMPDEAEASYREALRTKPDSATAHINLGNVLRDQGMLDEAVASYQRALQLEPDYAEAHQALGVAFENRGKFGEALGSYDRALKLRPDYAKAHWNRSLVWLRQGDFRNGWEAYEWRWKCEPPRRQFAQPVWDGSPPAGQRILVYAEQGVGDEIMFASCAKDVSEQAAECVIQCNPRLAMLFARSFPLATVVGAAPDADSQTAESYPEVDVQIAMGSLPRHLRPSLDCFPKRPKYLAPDPKLRETWRRRLAELGEGPKIGISWRGGKDPEVRKRRSTTLEQWAPLLAIDGVHFINLQYGDCADELRAAGQEQGVTIHDWEDADPLADLDQFAAQISALDLVTSVDNATVHMAGALGTAVWILLPQPAEWRWLLDREDSPWYPSARLFRQTQPGDWDTVFERVAGELRQVVEWGGGGIATARPPADVTLPHDAVQERAKYERVWGFDQYRQISPGLDAAERVRLVEKLREHGVVTVLDAGCGTGKLMQKLIVECGDEFDVHGFDISANCLDPFFDDIKDDVLRVGCLWNQQDFCEAYDAIVCTDVLEHVPTEHVPAVLRNFRKCTRKVCYLAIALFPDGFGPALVGESLHLTVKEPGWWLAALSEAGFQIESWMVERDSTGKDLWLHAFLTVSQ